MIDLINDDCMNIMKDYEDNHFDLAIVDPPYGLGNKLFDFEINLKTKIRKHTKKDWNIVPNKNYFNELFRVSKNQIIWGANYFTKNLPISKGWIFWDKKYEGMHSFSDGELAYTSFNRLLKSFTYRGGATFNTSDVKNTFHPTQKPIKLYEWLLHNYAEKGQKILDTHLGSGSIAIACHYFGCDLVGVEIDKEYYDSAVKRIDQLTRQESLFI